MALNILVNYRIIVICDRKNKEEALYDEVADKVVLYSLMIAKNCIIGLKVPWATGVNISPCVYFDFQWKDLR